jgi:hypothetical protein
MASRLAFIEVPDQLQYVPDDFNIVALSPLVEVAVEQAGRPYMRPEDYLDERELEEEGIANFKRVEEICRRLDAYIQQEVPLAKAYHLQPALYNFFRLKVIYDAFFLRAYQLRRILKTERPRQILCFERAQPDLQREWFSTQESLYTPILDTLAQYLPFELSKRQASLRQEGESDSEKFVFPIRWRWKYVLSSRFGVVSDLVCTLVSRRKTGSVLCLDLGYNLHYIARELIRNGVSVWIWDHDNHLRHFRSPLDVCRELPPVSHFCPHELQSLSERILARPEWQAFWTWEGYNYWPIAHKRLERVFKFCLPEAIRYFMWAGRALDSLRPGVILTSTLAHPRERIIAHASQARGIPVIVSHHGALGTVYAPIHFYQDIDFVDGYLCYGTGVANYVRKYARGTVCSKVVGSSRIARVRQEAPSRRAIRRYLGLDVRKPVVSYAPTAMDGNWRYLSYRAPSDSTCFRVHRQILSVLGRHPEYQVIVKTHSDLIASVFHQWLSCQGWSHVKLITDVPFSALVNLVDTLIVDLPSTTLLEALQTNSAIYVFNNWVKWEPGTIEALRKVAFYSGDLDVFCERLDADLADGTAVQPRPRDEEFLRLFCLPKGDVPSARIAAQAIQEVLETGRLSWSD